jgi:hypothetical protein
MGIAEHFFQGLIFLGFLDEEKKDFAFYYEKT